MFPRKSWLHLCLVAVALSCAFAAHAADDVVLTGPTTYTAEAGKPQVFETTFAADLATTCTGAPLFVLRVENGDERGRNRITAPSVKLNGIEVLAARDFASGITVIERVVALQSANRLATELKGAAAGAFLRISVRREFQQTVAENRVFRLTANGRQSFDATVAVTPAGWTTLVLATGSADPRKGIKRGRVTVNGKTVLAESEFGALPQRIDVELQAENAVHLDLDGDAASTATLSFVRRTVMTGCAPILKFDTPADRAVVNGPAVIVTGTVSGSRNVGVTVNGITAEIDLTHAGTVADPLRWAVQLQLPDGAADLKAIATTIEHAESTLQRSITVVAPPEEASVIPVIASGVVPFDAQFDLQIATPNHLQSCAIDFEDDGTFEAIPCADDTVGHTYSSAGLHRVRTRFTSTAGATWEVETVVVAHDFATMNAHLNAIWTTFSGALAAANVDRALAVLSPSARTKYGDVLRGIQTRLPAYAASLRAFHPARLDGDTARYLLVRDEDGRTFGHHVYFAKDADGTWRLLQF
jgi:hypothetical protein